MKSLKLIINCVTELIKKIIFKLEKTDIYQECENVIGFNENPDLDEEKSQVEEYLKNYKVTTRWQTI